MDSSHRESVLLHQLQDINQNQFISVTCRSLLDRYALSFDFKGLEVIPRTCRFGHEKKEKGVQSGVEAAQAHRHVKVHIETLSSVHKQLHIVEEVQESGGCETHQEDDKHQRAGLDVHRPVMVGSVELTDDSGIAQNRDHQRQQEAKED